MFNRNEHLHIKKEQIDEEIITLEDKNGRSRSINKQLWHRYWRFQNKNGSPEPNCWAIPYFEEIESFVKHMAKPSIINEIIKILEKLNITPQDDLHESLKAKLILGEVYFQFPAYITHQEVRAIAEKSYELFQVDYEVIKEPQGFWDPVISWHLKADMTTIFNKFYIEPCEKCDNSLLPSNG